MVSGLKKWVRPFWKLPAFGLQKDLALLYVIPISWKALICAKPFMTVEEVVWMPELSVGSRHMLLLTTADLGPLAAGS